MALGAPRMTAALAAALALAGPAAAGPRVMSLDSCADQYVLALSPPASIVGVSGRADDPDSYLRQRARGVPVRRATAESVLAARPDVVVRYWGGDARLQAALVRRGVRVVRIDEAGDFGAVRGNVRRVAAALDNRAGGEALIAGMDRKLAAGRNAWGGAPALYFTPTGYTTGPGTLVDAILRGAGLVNTTRGAAWEPVALESLVLAPPARFVLGFFDAFTTAMGRWGPGRHAALRKRLPGRTIAVLPASVLGCPAWFAADGVETLARARR